MQWKQIRETMPMYGQMSLRSLWLGLAYGWDAVAGVGAMVGMARVCVARQKLRQEEAAAVKER